MNIKLVNNNYLNTGDSIYSISDDKKSVAVRVDALDRTVMPHDFEPTLTMLEAFQQYTGDDATHWIQIKKAERKEIHNLFNK